MAHNLQSPKAEIMIPLDYAARAQTKTFVFPILSPKIKVLAGAGDGTGKHLPDSSDVHIVLSQ
jgi:hypothetical protein